MSKYKIKRKTNKNVYIAVAVICVLLVTSIGYSLWKDTLYITGSIYAKYVEPKLENVEVVADSNGDYVKKEEDKSWISTVNGYGLEKSTLTDNERLEIFAKYVGNVYVVSGRDIYLRTSFINNNPVELTSGKFEIIGEKTLDYDITFTMPETVPVGETATLEMKFYIRSGMRSKTGDVQYRVSYKVGEVTRYLYFTISAVK